MFSDDELAVRYLDAKTCVMEAGFERELDWCLTRNLRLMSEAEVLREAAWVIINSGFREKTARMLWPRIKRAWGGFASARDIVENREAYMESALEVFGHRGKMGAIASIATEIDALGIEVVKSCIEDQGLSYLSSWPYIGVVTVYHLARNFGLPFAKPDRHLVRLTEYAGFESAQALCERIHVLVGDPVGLVDLVLWRWCTLGKTWVDTGRPGCDLCEGRGVIECAVCDDRGCTHNPTCDCEDCGGQGDMPCCNCRWYLSERIDA